MTKDLRDRIAAAIDEAATPITHEEAMERSHGSLGEESPRKGATGRRLLPVAVIALLAVAGAVVWVYGSQGSGVDNTASIETHDPNAEPAGRGTPEVPTLEPGIEVFGEGDDGEVLTVQPLGGTITKLEDPEYSSAMKRLLGLEKVEILRRTDKDASGNPITWDEVNRYASQPGFEASIYHQVPSSFASEHESGGFIEVETDVGPAWASITGGDAVSVALIDIKNQRVVRVVHYSEVGSPAIKLQSVVDKAVEISEDQSVIALTSSGGD